MSSYVLQNLGLCNAKSFCVNTNAFCVDAEKLLPLVLIKDFALHSPRLPGSADDAKSDTFCVVGGLGRSQMFFAFSVTLLRSGPGSIDKGCHGSRLSLVEPSSLGEYIRLG